MSRIKGTSIYLSTICHFQTIFFSIHVNVTKSQQWCYHRSFSAASYCCLETKRAFPIHLTVIWHCRKWLMFTLHCLTREPDSPPEVIHWYKVNNQTPSGAISLLGNPTTVIHRIKTFMLMSLPWVYRWFYLIFFSFFLFFSFAQWDTTGQPAIYSFFLVSPERTIEDHESVMEVLSGWGMDTDSRLYFRKNFAKYEFFRRPLVSLQDLHSCCSVWWVREFP